MDYAWQRLIGIGGVWHQGTYKDEFFDRFFDAYWSGGCGAAANQKFNKTCVDSNANSLPTEILSSLVSLSGNYFVHSLGGRKPTKKIVSVWQRA